MERNEPNECPSIEINERTKPSYQTSTSCENNHTLELSKDEDTFVKPDFINVQPLKKRSIFSAEPVQQNDENDENDGSSEKIIPPKVKLEKAPSQYIAEKEIPIPYKEPSWSGLLPQSYNFEVIKNGVVIENIPLNKPYIVVGRLSNCDIIMEHPSISRFHCVIQCRIEKSEDEPPGVYVYDMDSTHGTFQNKCRLEPKMFNRLKVGHILKFGGSTRLFVLQGPDEDQEPESQHTVTELIALAKEKKLKLQKLESEEIEVKEKVNVSKKAEETDCTMEGVDWGMGEDAQEKEEGDEEDGEGFQNPFVTNEELYLDDPKKTLRGWFEREGHDLPDYQLEEIKPGHFQGKLELPGLASGGKPVLCVVEHKGKKKETVVHCALEACRILDQRGLLRQATHEGHQKRRKDWSENDYYDSDEDDFLDRTGDIERKRRLRKRMSESAKGIGSEVETYDSLTRQYAEIIQSLEKLEKDLKLVEDLKKEREEVSGDASVFSDADELEAYMNHLSSQVPDKHKRIAWKLEVVRLQKEEVRLRRLINLVRPLGIAELPERHSEYSDPRKGNTKSIPHGNESILKGKAAPALKVHEAFLEEEEEAKPKIRKVKCDDDDDDQGILPVPYAKPPKTIDKYRGLLTRDRTRPCATAVPNPSFLEANIIAETTLNSTSTVATSERVLAPEADVLPSLNEGDVHPPEGKDCTSEDKVGLENNSRKRVVGPSLPITEKQLKFAKPCLGLSLAKNKFKEEEKSPTKRKRNPFDFEEQYETWVPPKGQTGDGRTALNDKLGY